MDPNGPDAQDLAFAALQPLARPTADALHRVDAAVDDERRQADPLRHAFTPTLRAGLLGLARFGYAVREVGLEWAHLPAVQRTSTPEQEGNNIFLWMLGDRYQLRIKRDPVEGVNEGTRRLFVQLPALGRPTQVFLTWDINLDGGVLAPRFACIEEPKWTISLAQLLAHDAAPVIPLPASDGRGLVVRSKALADDRDQTEHGHQRGES